MVFAFVAVVVLAGVLMMGSSDKGKAPAPEPQAQSQLFDAADE